MGARVEAAFRRRFGVGDPPARDDQQLLRVAGPELVAPALVGGLTHQTRGGAQRPGELAPFGRRSKRWRPARCPVPPGRAVRSRRTPPPPVSAHRRALRRRRARARRHRGRPPGARRPGRRPAGRARRTSSPRVATSSACSRRRLSACAAGRSTSNQRTAPPPKRKGRPSSPAPRSTIWAVPRPSARATSASITRVRCASADGAADGDAHAARNGAVEARAPPRRRRRAWTGACAPAGAVGPPPSAPAARGARVDGASAARCQEVTALAVAILGCPKRNDR